MGQERSSGSHVCYIRAMVLLCLWHTMWGQNAQVSGRISDISGAGIPSVAVELINRATQVKLPTLSNAEGIFIFPSVAPGLYEVNARITGFNIISAILTQ